MKEQSINISQTKACRWWGLAFIIMIMVIITVGCSNLPPSTPATSNEPATSLSPQPSPSPDLGETNGEQADGQDADLNNDESQDNLPNHEAAFDMDSVAVLVNKEYALRDDYEPTDLVYPNVRFIFKEQIEKRMMRKEAAAALEELFAGAEKDGIYLAGVSAYRSHQTQTSLFNRYVKRDGEEKAKTYSAVPGHSEHETGLSIDVTTSDGKCAAEDCFGETQEAKWLAEHAAEYGFIVRYPEGKEGITGYKYEPWHIRYVGTEISKYVADHNITLEEYYNAVPVSDHR